MKFYSDTIHIRTDNSYCKWCLSDQGITLRGGVQRLACINRVDGDVAGEGGSIQRILARV